MKLTKFFALLCAVLGFVACGNENGADEVATIFMQVDKEVVNIGETVTFTVTDADGNDLTSSAVIYDSEWAELEGPTFTPEKSGIFTFIASVGATWISLYCVPSQCCQQTQMIAQSSTTVDCLSTTQVLTAVGVQQLLIYSLILLRQSGTSTTTR